MSDLAYRDNPFTAVKQVISVKQSSFLLSRKCNETLHKKPVLFCESKVLFYEATVLDYEASRLREWSMTVDP